MRFSSGFKVGVLTLAAILILVFTVLWVKGRSISGGERITVSFKDINGLRAGSGVQMMGVRIGQIESLTPNITPDDSRVDVKFVITEPDIKIPTASEISIQQSGIIGEQFLEVTPPAVRHLYVPFKGKNNILHVGDKVEMLLSKEYVDIGEIKKAEIIETKTLDPVIAENIDTDYAFKIGYSVNMPGLILPEMIKGEAVSAGGHDKLLVSPVKSIEIIHPVTDSPYTIIEPMRIADFMKLQYRSASALAETNEKLSAVLSDDVMEDIKQTIKNADALTANANQAIDKATALMDISREEMLKLSVQANDLTDKLNKIADNIVKITGDKEFTTELSATVKNVNKLSSNVNKILEDPDTEILLHNISETAKNINEISDYVNGMTKDPELKVTIKDTLKKLNTSLDKLSIALDTVNYVTEDERDNIKKSLKEIESTTENVKKFSDKLNKRFLLFRLMF